MNEPPKQSDGLKQAVTFEDQRITIISDIDLTIKENQRQRLTAFATILCTSGSCELSVNSRDFTLAAKSMLVCTPGDTIEVVDVVCRCEFEHGELFGIFLECVVKLIHEGLQQ